MLVRRKVFLEMEGFNEELPKAFNDIDFCLRVRKAGHLITYTPEARFFHLESVSRGYDKRGERQFEKAIKYMHDVWDSENFIDPYYNPNLTRDREDYSLRC